MKTQKTYFLTILFFCSISIIAQNKGVKPIEGSCKDVIKTLRELYRNDSVAFDVFKTKYDITNTTNTECDSLLNINYIEAIRFFNSERGEKYVCRSRVIELRPQVRHNDYVLLKRSLP